MTDDLGRRGFLQGLLAALGGATLVRHVPEIEMRAIAGEAIGPALEYEPGVKGKVTQIYAHCSHSPRKLDKNFGFRYLTRGRAPNSVRLYYEVELKHATVHLQPDAENISMVVTEVGRNHIEIMAYDMTVERAMPANFSVLVIGERVTT